MTSNGKFSILDWQEEVAHDLPGTQKLSRASVKTSHTGVLSGILTTLYTLVYSEEGRSEFSGVGVFEGRLNDKEGRYAIIEIGRYQNGEVSVTFELRSLNVIDALEMPLATGHYKTGDHADIPYRLDVITFL